MNAEVFNAQSVAQRVPKSGGRIENVGDREACIHDQMFFVFSLAFVADVDFGCADGAS